MQEAVAKLAADLQSTPVAASNLHVTLCFLGQVDEARVDDLRRLASSVRARHCELEFDAFDVWKKPRILCAVTSADVPAEAASLAESLRVATNAAGFAPDDRPWRPHLTLARKVRGNAEEPQRWPQKFAPGFVVRGERFLLMESRRGEAGSAYSVVDSWALYEK